MDLTWQTCSEEGEDCPIGQKDDGVIYIDYLEKGKMVTGLYYAKLLGRFDVKLQKKQPHLSKSKVLFHHDNTPDHTAIIATVNWLNCTTNC